MQSGTYRVSQTWKFSPKRVRPSANSQGTYFAYMEAKKQCICQFCILYFFHLAQITELFITENKIILEGEGHF